MTFSVRITLGGLFITHRKELLANWLFAYQLQSDIGFWAKLIEELNDAQIACGFGEYSKRGKGV